MQPDEDKVGLPKIINSRKAPYSLATHDSDLLFPSLEPAEIKKPEGIGKTIKNK